MVVPGTGMHVNNMMGEQDLSPAGLLHAPAGAAAAVDDGADRRARAAACPSSCSGRPGSNRIRCALLQVIVGVIDHGLRRARPPWRRRGCTSRTGWSTWSRASTSARSRPRAGRSRGSASATCSSAAARRSSGRPHGVLSGGGDPRRGGAVVVAVRSAAGADRRRRRINGLAGWGRGRFRPRSGVGRFGVHSAPRTGPAARWAVLRLARSRSRSAARDAGSLAPHPAAVRWRHDALDGPK